MSAFVLTCAVAAFAPWLSPSVPDNPPAGAVDEISATCPVCGKTIAPGQGSKVLVRDHEYTVDDAACGEALVANPDKYLNADGTAKNAKKPSKVGPK